MFSSRSESNTEWSRSQARLAEALATWPLLDPVFKAHPHVRPTTLAVVPVAGDAPAVEVAAGLAAALSQYGSTLHLNSAWLPDLFGREAVGRLDNAHDLEELGWLHSRVREHSAIVLQADPAFTPWTRCCLA